LAGREVGELFLKGAERVVSPVSLIEEVGIILGVMPYPVAQMAEDKGILLAVPDGQRNVKEMGIRQNWFSSGGYLVYLPVTARILEREKKEMTKLVFLRRLPGLFTGNGIYFRKRKKGKKIISPLCKC
jgi:hypothetical protein